MYLSSTLFSQAQSNRIIRSLVKDKVNCRKFRDNKALRTRIVKIYNNVSAHHLKRFIQNSADIFKQKKKKKKKKDLFKKFVPNIK
jgi:hypothetical protein